VLWSAVFITVSTLYRPIDQLLSRHISERRQLGQPIGEPMRVAARIQLGLAVAFVALALALRGPLQDDLLSGNETLYWVFFSAVLGYAASYFARGFLAGNRQFGLFSLLILSESIFRTAFAVIVAVGLFHGQSVVALGIVAAPCLSLIVVPLAFARRAQTQAEPQPEPADADSGEGAAPEFSLAHGAGFAASVLLIMFSEQTFLNAGPLLIHATSGAAAAGFIFNVLMVARAPLQLFQAIGTSILPHLTGLHHSDEEGSDELFRSSVRYVILAVAAFASVVGLVVLAIGPQLMHIAFGKKFDYDRLGLLIVTAGMGLYLSAVTINQACLAQGQVRRASIRWIICAVFFVGWTLLPVISNEYRRVEIGFTLTAASLLTMLYLIYRKPIERPEDAVEPGSTEELEGLVAAADEAS
jgi:O-antigen/teichoic acid export membrane protein